MTEKKKDQGRANRAIRGKQARPERRVPLEPQELPEDVLVGRNAVTEALRAGRDINRLLLAEGDREEEELLRSFAAFARPYSRLVHFNGDTFDIPFIRERCRRYQMPDPFAGKQSLDM